MGSLSNTDSIYTEIEKHYGNAARTKDVSRYAQRVADAFGYSAQDLEDMPEDANLGLSCGNPLALANIKEGETIVDLGSGAGFDVFQAAKRVGKNGRAIGVDFNKAMLDRANGIKAQTNSLNVSFVESRITDVLVPDAIADCVISNCVINLVPENEKQRVFNEIFRILKAGGRVAVSDILATKQLPPHVKDSMGLYVGCIAGASQVCEYEEYLKNAGFDDILIVNAKSDLNIYKEQGGAACCPPVAPKDGGETQSCCGPKTATVPTNSIDQVDYNEFAGSFKIYAVKR